MYTFYYKRAVGLAGTRKGKGFKMAVKYPDRCTAVIDVTKPPYNVDNTGTEDCTAKLVKILDDILRPNVEKLQQAKQKLLDLEDPNGRISFEIRKENDILYVIFPEELEPTKILYFPNGTYLLSDTVSYSIETLCNIYEGLYKYEMNRQIHFLGESEHGVIFKLQDHAKGFEYGAKRPVVSFMQAEESNLAMTNTFENITIDTGKGNPGAIGLVFFGNNTGCVKNVTIKSSDPSHRGYAGLVIEHEIVSGSYVKNLTVDGFDYGIRCIPVRNYTVFEHIKIRNQRKAGFFVNNMVISIRDLQSSNSVTGLVIKGALAHVVLLDSKFEGGFALATAVDCACGSCFLRNINVEGYGTAVVYAQAAVRKDRYIREYLSDAAITAFDTAKESLHMEVEEAPEISIPGDAAQWAVSSDYGAVGDGITDDTDALRKLFSSGKEYIVLQAGRYYIDGCIEIPPCVKYVNFMFCDMVSGENIQNMRDKGVFRVLGDAAQPLVLENVFTWEKFYGYMRFIEHAGKRTLVMRNLHTQTAAMYFNSVEGGTVFVENCACTVGGDPYRGVPAYAFAGQTVWARHINPERSLCEILNDHSKLWIMGFKTENYGTAFKTVNGGSTEVLGGTISIGTGKELPAIINENSDVSVVAVTNGYGLDQLFPIAVKETQNGETAILEHDVFPLRLLRCYKIPLYVGRKAACRDKG